MNILKTLWEMFGISMLFLAIGACVIITNESEYVKVRFRKIFNPFPKKFVPKENNNEAQLRNIINSLNIEKNLFSKSQCITDRDVF